MPWLSLVPQQPRCLRAQVHLFAVRPSSSAEGLQTEGNRFQSAYAVWIHLLVLESLVSADVAQEIPAEGVKRTPDYFL